jgi:hypothetical protein
VEATATKPWRSQNVGGHEILTADGHEADRWRTRKLTAGGHELPSGGHQTCLID